MDDIAMIRKLLISTLISLPVLVHSAEAKKPLHEQLAWFRHGTPILAPADSSGPNTLAANPFQINVTGNQIVMVNTVGGRITNTAQGSYTDSAGGVCNIPSNPTGNSGNPWPFQFSHSVVQQWLVGRTAASGCDSGGTVNPFSVVASISRPPNAIAKLYNPGYVTSTDCIAVSDGSTTVFSSRGGEAAPHYVDGFGVDHTCSQGAYYPFLKLIPVPGTMTLTATFGGVEQTWSDNGTVDQATPSGVIVSSMTETSGSAVITRASGSFITDGVKAGMIVAGEASTKDMGLFVQSVDSATQITMSGVTSCATVSTLSTPSRTGNGTLALAAVPLATPALTGAQAGTYKVIFTSATTFNVSDPSSVFVASGSTGVNFANQIQFKITAGSTPFIVGDEFDISVTLTSCSNVRKGFGTGGVWFVPSGNFAGGAVRLYLTQEYGDASAMERIGSYYFQFSTPPDAGTQIKLSYSYGWVPANNQGTLSTATAPSYSGTLTRMASYLLPSADDPVAAARAIDPLFSCGSQSGSGIACLDPAVSYGIPAGQSIATPCTNPLQSCNSSSTTNRNPSFVSGQCPGWTGGGWAYTYNATFGGYSSGDLVVNQPNTTICGADLYSTPGKFRSGQVNTTLKYTKVNYTLAGASAAGVSFLGTSGYTAIGNEVYARPTLAQYAAMGVTGTNQPVSCYTFGPSSTTPVTNVDIEGNLAVGCSADGFDIADMGNSSGDTPIIKNNVITDVGFSLQTHADILQWVGLVGNSLWNVQMTGNYFVEHEFWTDPAGFPNYSAFPESLAEVNGQVYLDGFVSSGTCGMTAGNINITSNAMSGGNGFIRSPLTSPTTSSPCGTKVNSFIGSISGSVLTIDGGATITLTSPPATTTLSCPGCPSGINITGAVGGGTTANQWNLDTTLGSPITSQTMFTGYGYWIGLTYNNNYVGTSSIVAPQRAGSTASVAPLTETGNRRPDSGYLYPDGSPY